MDWARSRCGEHSGRPAPAPAAVKLQPAAASTAAQRDGRQPPRGAGGAGEGASGAARPSADRGVCGDTERGQYKGRAEEQAAALGSEAERGVRDREDDASGRHVELGGSPSARSVKSVAF